MTTGKNLHSHHGVPSPLSRHNNEVTGFGTDGEGDGSDNWQLECVQMKKDKANDGEPPSRSEKHTQVWERSTVVHFRHVETHHWLSGSSKLKFNDSNCPTCPIKGELEVSGSNRFEESSIFQVEEGAFLHTKRSTVPCIIRIIHTQLVQ